MFNTLISIDQLLELQRSGKPLMVFDCSYDLSNPAIGQTQYARAHIPGAVHADLSQHLSSQHAERKASGGRHPLPLREDFMATLRQWGFSNDMQAVVYDRNGCNYCGRLWWMLQWLGHDAVAVLDGGLQAWKAAGHATASAASPEAPPSSAVPGSFAMSDPLVELIGTQDVAASLPAASLTLIDARGAPRYRGEVEPLDPVAGHIPGAINRPFTDNFDSQGCFKPPAVLREEWQALLQGKSATARTVVYCGSGVSTLPNLLSLQLAGYERPALYAGSWSAWCATSGLPVERG